MSMCSGPNCPHCPPVEVEIPTPRTVEEMEADLAELRSMRSEARELARSGNPAVRAEGQLALVEIPKLMRFIHEELRSAEQ